MDTRDQVRLLTIGVFIAIAIAAAVAFVLINRAKQRKRDAPPLPVSEKFNTLAILSFVLSFFVSIAAIVLGHIAISQISRTNDRGRGLAVAGLVIGYVSLIGGIVGSVILITRLASIY